eukprot:5120573-Pleurochrysis_carterae.AAC.1
MQAVHACDEELEAHRTLGGVGEASGASSKYGGQRRVGYQDQTGSHAEAGRRVPCRAGPHGAACATANANGKGGWGQK